MQDIGVIGRNEFVLGFRLAGISKVTECDEKTFLATVTKQMEDAEVGILIVDEVLLDTIDSSDLYDLERSVQPVIIGVSEKASQDNLRRMIKKSIGVDLWKSEE